MKLEKSAGWYNPYFVRVGNKYYELKDIHFFNNKGIFLSCGRGWFGGNNTIGNIELGGECKRKLKPDFTSKNPFILPPKKKEIFEIKGNYPYVELYLPIDFYKWTKKKDNKKHNYVTESSIYDTYFVELKKGLVIEIDVLNRREKIKENADFLKRVKPILKEMEIDGVSDSEIIRKRVVFEKRLNFYDLVVNADQDDDTKKLKAISFRINKADYERGIELLNKLKGRSWFKIRLRLNRSDFYRLVFREGLKSLEGMVESVHTCSKCGKRIAVTVPRHLRDRLDICTCEGDGEK